MSACCGEPECRRKQPFHLYRGDFTGRAYLVTQRRMVHARPDGTATFSATNRHDITPQMREFIRANADWVREVLSER